MDAIKKIKAFANRQAEAGAAMYLPTLREEYETCKAQSAKTQRDQEAQLADMQVQLTKAQQEHTAQQADVQRDHAAQLADMQVQLTKAQQEYAAQLADMQVQLTKTRQEHAIQLATFQAKIALLAKSEHELQAQNAQLSNDLRVLNDRCSQTGHELLTARQQLEALHAQLSERQPPQPFGVQRQLPFQVQGVLTSPQTSFFTQEEGVDMADHLSLDSPIIYDYDDNGQHFLFGPIAHGQEARPLTFRPSFTSTMSISSSTAPLLKPASLEFDQPAETPGGKVTVFQDINQTSNPGSSQEKKRGKNVTTAWINEYVVDNERFIEKLTEFGVKHPICQGHMEPLRAAIAGLARKNAEELPAAQAAVHIAFREFYNDKLKQDLRLFLKQALDPSAIKIKRQRAT
jgi:hypothetical protein